MKFNEFYNKNKNIVEASTASKITKAITTSDERESFYSSNLFQKYDLVESNGTIYRVINKGSNYFNVVDNAGTIVRKFASALTLSEQQEPVFYTKEPISFHGFSPENLSEEQTDAFNTAISRIENGEEIDDIALLKLIKTEAIMDQEYKVKDKLVIARMIADAVGVSHENMVSPEQLIMTAMRAAAKNPALVRNKDILQNMLDIAKSVGINVQKSVFDRKEVDEAMVKVAKDPDAQYKVGQTVKYDDEGKISTGVIKGREGEHYTVGDKQVHHSKVKGFTNTVKMAESEVPAHMQGKQKPYVSHTKAGFEVLGNKGQVKATFTKAEHGTDARKNAEKHLYNYYHDYLDESYNEDDIANGGTVIYKHDGKHHMSKVSHKTGGGAGTKIHTEAKHVVPLHNVVSTDASDWNRFKNKIDEVSYATLASYKEKAGADASSADAKGDMKKGDKRFKGLMRATSKEFEKDAVIQDPVNSKKKYSSMMDRIREETIVAEELTRRGFIAGAAAVAGSIAGGVGVSLIHKKVTNTSGEQHATEHLKKHATKEEFDKHEHLRKDYDEKMTASHVRRSAGSRLRADDAQRAYKKHRTMLKMKYNYDSKEANESVELEEQTHRIMLTVSKADHDTMALRSVKQKVHVNVKAPVSDDYHHDDAVENAKHHMMKKGYKVHAAEHIGMVKEDVNEGAEESAALEQHIKQQVAVVHQIATLPMSSDKALKYKAAVEELARAMRKRGTVAKP